MIHNTLDNRKIVLFGNGTVRITSAYLGEDEKGILSLNASPLTVATPILTPVKEPGPAVTAIASRSDIL